ncbi:hypothetical protein LSH36_5g03027 [Paralvinella palmiformis]|uniref:Uncharacterized protein n=1 Tax=Paralvinella palmiformis TaxID=53620 RepID=A0AAD9KEP1_9ANNE|nr:hypothetical protein LSH36_5g03027 [Paralvinella palmiformis]
MVISPQITKTAGQLPTDVSLSQPSCIHRHHQQQPQALGEWLEFSGQPRVPLSRYVMPQGKELSPAHRLKSPVNLKNTYHSLPG